MEERERVWIRRAMQGDREAFCHLVEAYQAPVYNLAYRMLGSATEAEDAAQETFVRAYLKLHTYQPERKFSTWLLSIASHYCIDHLRRQRFSWLPLENEPGNSELRSQAHGPEEQVLRSETQDEMQAMVSSLAPGYRVPVVLRYWYDLSYGEIAQIMGISLQTVKTRLHRARLQLSGTAVRTLAAPLREAT